LKMKTSVKPKLWLAISLFTVLGGVVSGRAQAYPAADRVAVAPLLIVVVDKLDSVDVFQSKLPGMRRLIRESAAALLSIRSGSGYTKTNSGYLSLGAGVRSAAPDRLGGLMAAAEPFRGITAREFWEWTAPPMAKTKSNGLLVPEIGRLSNLVLKVKRLIKVGRLGTLFRENGWQTVVYSNNDRFEERSRPGGLLLMDRYGVVDHGGVDLRVTVTDPHFPFLKRIDPIKAFELLKTAVKPRRLVLLDFNDLARLDYYQDLMPDKIYEQAKQATLRRLDQLLMRILNEWPVQKLSLVVVSPSNSLTAYKQKRLLAPLVIRSVKYRAGVLSSGTTRWPGIVSNLDFLPTLMTLAQIPLVRKLEGRPMQVAGNRRHEVVLATAMQRINAILAVQRQILDWFLGLITGGWLIGFGCGYLKWSRWGERILTGVAVIPLVLIIMPLFPPESWQVSIFLILTGALTFLFGAITEYRTRFLVLAGLTWTILVIDQATGWHLIRYSALGYSPAAGARYYGIGNEYMGIFLILSLVLTELIYSKTDQRWPAWLVLGVGVVILGWPRFGINFGGTLAALVGFSFYLFRLYQWDWRNKKLWLIVAIGLALILIVGYWDAQRAAQTQTHVGRFFGLLFSNRFGQIITIILRKLEMNLKLMAFSPWARIVWLTLGMTTVSRLLTPNALFSASTSRIGQAILIAGLAVCVFNDSGVVALATGLTFGISYLLIAFQKENNLRHMSPPPPTAGPDGYNPDGTVHN
jgi:hypothetical protein